MIFGISGVELGGLDMKIGKTSKFIKIDLYMSIPTFYIFVENFYTPYQDLHHTRMSSNEMD